MEIMRRQLELLRASGPATRRSPPATAAPRRRSDGTLRHPDGGRRADAAPAPAPFGPYRPPATGPTRRAHRPAGSRRSTPSSSATRGARPSSKRLTAANRPHLADPRSVAGFRLLWKEMVYPIVTTRSAGSQLWDLDGNEYVDLTNGFGIDPLRPQPAVHPRGDRGAARRRGSRSARRRRSRARSPAASRPWSGWSAWRSATRAPRPSPPRSASPAP